MVQERVIPPHELVKDILQDGSGFCKFEYFKFTLRLHLLVGVVVERQVFNGPSPVRILEASSELRKHLVAGVDDELEVGTAAFLVENENELV